MTPDPYALSTLLRSTGRTSVEIARLLRERNRRVSAAMVCSWCKLPGATNEPSRPRWYLLADLADALDIPRATLYAACAGESDAPSYEDGVRAAREEVDAARRWWASHVGISEGEEANRDRTVAEALAVVVAQIDLLDPETISLPSPPPPDQSPVGSASTSPSALAGGTLLPGPK